MDEKRRRRIELVGYLVLGLGSSASSLPACASDQKSAVSAEEVRDGEALPPAPAVPASSAPVATAAASGGGGTGNAPPRGEAPTSKETLTESQIAKVTDLINTAEIAQAKLAQSRGKAPDVKQFADKMLKHHDQAQREQAKIEQRLKLTRADSATAAKVASDGEAQLAKLKGADAASFDAAYISSQLDAHQQALDLLDTQLIPNAKTPEVVNALQIARETVDQHLREARALQK
jgi:putative membrane protein